MPKVLVISADTSKSVGIENLPTDQDEQLKKMQKLVNGYIEMAPLPTSEVCLWCNEEGKLQNLPFNKRASELWEQIWGEPINDCLVGDVFFSGPVNDEGELTDLPDYVIKANQKMLDGLHRIRKINVQ